MEQAILKSLRANVPLKKSLAALSLPMAGLQVEICFRANLGDIHNQGKCP